MKRHEQRVSDSIVSLMRHEPFYSCLLSMLKKRFAPVGTACVDGENLVFDPKYVEAIKKEEVTGLLLHEVLHVGLLHCDKNRCSKYPRHVKNIAADLIVNAIIRSMQKAYKLPPGGLIDDSFLDLTLEEACEKLMNKVDNKQFVINQDGLQVDDQDGHGGFDKHKQKPLSPAQSDGLKRKIMVAAEASKLAGTVPLGLRRMIENIRKPKIDWREQLRQYTKTVLGHKSSTWLPPNRRYVWSNSYFPSRKGNSVSNLCISIDTSGSIGEKELSMFAGVIEGIMGVCSRCTVMTADAEVHEVVEVRSFREVMKSVQFKGGGGTSHKPVFEEIQKRKLHPKLLICITDAFSDFPDKKPPYPVIWVLTENHGNPPSWGKRIVMED